MKKRFRLLLTAAVAMAAAVFIGGCGAKGGGDKASGTKSEVGGTQASSGKKTDLVFWVHYSDDGLEAIYKLQDKFNKQSDKYRLKVEYGGSQVETRQKLASYDKKNYPSLFTCDPDAMYDYEHAAYVKPLQYFLDKDKDKWTDDIFPSVKRAYSSADGKTMLGGLMGVSIKGWYVNLDMIESAGYKLEDITSLEKVAEIAQAVHDKGLCKYGYTPYSNHEIVEMLSYQGVPVFDQDNGYSGDVTKCLFNEGETKNTLKKILSLYSKMAQGGSFYYGGGGAQGYSMFTNQQEAFWGGTNSFVYNIKDLKLPFKWAFIPAVGVDGNAKYKGCAMPEGTGIFVCDTGDEAEMQGAYEVIKFLAEPENQVEWCTYRGYVPYTNAAANNEKWLKWSKEVFPSGQKLVEQIKNTPEDLRLPYNPVAQATQSADNRLGNLISSDPKGNLDSYIKEVSDSINTSLEWMNIRK